MHRHLSLIALAVVCATPAAALDLPARKPGREIKMTMEGRNIAMPSSQHCIDAETDKLMNAIGNARQEMCSKRDVQKVGSTIVVDSVCKVGEATTTSHARGQRRLQQRLHRQGQLQARGRPRDCRVCRRTAPPPWTIDAKWLSACAADQKPGDMIIAGRKMNIRDMAECAGNAEAVVSLTTLPLLLRHPEVLALL